MSLFKPSAVARSKRLPAKSSPLFHPAQSAQSGRSPAERVAPGADAQSRPETAAAENSRSFGFTILILQLFIVYSRITDLVGLFLGVPSFLVLIISIVGLLAVVFTRGVEPALRSKPGILLTLLTVWLCICVPFSIWKGGSVQLLEEYWIKTYLDFIIVAGLVTTVVQCRKAIYTIALAVMFVCFVSLVVHTRSDRLDLEGGLLGNPNALAFFLIIALPCAVLMMSDSRKVYKATGGLIAATLMVLSLRTGSRMGLLMLAAVLGTYWLRTTAIKKVGLIVAVFVIGILGVLVSSKASLDRYRTMFSDDQQQNLDPNSEAAKAVGSSGARRALMQEALEYTWQHPLVGVGPGQFSVATGTDQMGKRGLPAWHETHNTYLQLSSEAGIPAALLYIAIVFYGIRTTYRVYRKHKNNPATADVANLAYALFVSNIAFVVGSNFGSVAYMFPYIVIIGLTVGLERGLALRSQSLPSIQIPVERRVPAFVHA